METNELPWTLAQCDRNDQTDDDSGLARRFWFWGLLALAIGVTVVGFASPAAACWDGYYASHKGITVQGGDDQWNSERARDLATWIPRIQSLIGEGTAEIYWGEASIDGIPDEVQFTPGRYDHLFRRIANRLGSSAAERRTAMAAAIDPLTIQVAATRDRDRAQRLAASLSNPDQGMFLHGFYEAGGFPADNEAAHVVAATDDAGNTIYRVVIGAFLSRTAADHALDELRTEHAIEGFVRDL